MAFNKISVPSVKETFVREIENKILSGELKIGEKLPPARNLCEIMGVSLTIVNAGINELVSKGFINVKPRHGTYVADYMTNGNPETLFAIMRYNGGKLNEHEVRSFCESRIALDPFVAELVIKRATDEQIAELGIILEKMESERDIDSFCVLITDFFRKMYFLSDNTFFALLYNSTVMPQRGMYAVFLQKNGFSHVLNNAKDIYGYLLSRDVENAKSCLIESMHLPLEGDTAIISNI